MNNRWLSVLNYISRKNCTVPLINGEITEDTHVNFLIKIRTKIIRNVALMQHYEALGISQL